MSNRYTYWRCEPMQQVVPVPYVTWGVTKWQNEYPFLIEFFFQGVGEPPIGYCEREEVPYEKIIFVDNKTIKLYDKV